MSFDLSHFNSLILIAGLSGAGKSTTMAALSDYGYFCIDNIPIPLLEQFLDFSRSEPSRFRRAAVLMDISSEKSREDILALLPRLKSGPHSAQMIFLDADNAAIVRRYSETRRPHPQFDSNRDKTLSETIAWERTILQPIKERADFSIDSSGFNVHQLRAEIRNFVDSLHTSEPQALRVNFLSFGFKFGAPLDCDMIADVRFLRNPHFVDHLRNKTGCDSEVSEYVFASPETGTFVEKYLDLLNFLLPKFIAEGKGYLNVGIGCTGGKHRSVAIAEELSKRVTGPKYLVSAKHRDKDR